MFRVSASELRKQFRRMGIKADVREVKASSIVITSAEGKEYVMESPQAVLLVQLPGGVAMIQAIGSIEERERREEEPITISEEDVKLVAEQAGVSMDEAREALIEARGDIAEAILLLEERKAQSGS